LAAIILMAHISQFALGDELLIVDSVLREGGASTGIFSLTGIFLSRSGLIERTQYMLVNQAVRLSPQYCVMLAAASHRPSGTCSGPLSASSRKPEKLGRDISQRVAVIGNQISDTSLRWASVSPSM
jgi:hypothetical protein